MSAAKHTPGPWELCESDDGHEIIMGTRLASSGCFSSHHIIEYNHGCDTDPTPGSAGERQALEAAANARLISAAPELLEALKGCADELEGAWKAIGADNQNRYVVEARAAIAKATAP